MFNAVTAGDREERDRGRVQPEQEEDRPVSASPQVLGQRRTVGKRTLNPAQQVPRRLCGRRSPSGVKLVEGVLGQVLPLVEDARV